MLKLNNIHVTLGKNTKLERTIINKLSLHVQAEEFIIIMGANGAGKSTLLDVISGSIKPDHGKIFIAGQDVTHTPQIYRARLVAKVAQDPKMGTMENMTIFENMAFAFKRGQTRNWRLFSNKSRIELFRAKLHMLNMNLENRMDDLVSSLSGGQRQALSLVMAILQDSNILLFDEITAALDPASSETIMELTDKMVRQQKTTCIIITHNIAHAIKYGDRLLLLKNGTFGNEYDSTAKLRLTQTEIAALFANHI